MGLFDWGRSILTELQRIRSELAEIKASQREANESLKRIEKAVASRLPRPEPIVGIRLKAERSVGDMFVLDYEVTLKEVEETDKNTDVVTRKLRTLVDGVESSVQELPRSVNAAVVTFPKGANAALRQSYVDDDGNEGPATDSSAFVATDTLPPDAPGPDFAALNLLREREVPDVEPEPEV